MVLVALLLACAEAPTFDPSGLVELTCSYSVESVPWETVVEGLSMEQRSDSVLGTHTFLNLNQDELFDLVGVTLSASADLPAVLTWQGEGCPEPELRIPLDGRWVIDGVSPTADCACVLDQADRVQCVGGLAHDDELEARLREFGPEGAGFFVQPPMVLDWDVQDGTASAEVWTEFMLWYDSGLSATQSVNIEMLDLEHQD